MSSIRPTAGNYASSSAANANPNFTFLSNQRLVGETQIQNIINSGQDTGKVVCPDGVTRDFKVKLVRSGRAVGGSSMGIEVTGDQGIPVTVATNVRR